MDNANLSVPEYGINLVPGDIIKIGRFADIEWIVSYGWYSFGGNRSVCGWFLVSRCNNKICKPLEYTDVGEIYLIEKR